jgi:hypothetical protein
MKNHLLLFFIIISHLLFSQTTLTQAFNEPVAGDFEKTFGLDTSAYTSGLPISVTGSNVVWDYSNVSGFEPILTNKYLSSSSVSSATNYAGCNLVQESGGLYTYLKSSTTPTTQTELLGLNVSSVSLTFTNSAVIAKYPVTYGSSSTDNLSGTFNFSISGTFTGSITTTADGIGTLNLPLGNSLTNVLRVKSVQTLTLSASLVAGFPPTAIARMQQSIYNYYSPQSKFPIISVNYSKITITLTNSVTITANANGNTNYFVVGLSENTLNDKDLLVYPNPTENKLTIGLTEPIHLRSVTLYSQLGELVLKTTSNSLNVSSLPAGIYIAEIITDKGLIRKKVIKE